MKRPCQTLLAALAFTSIGAHAALASVACGTLGHESYTLKAGDNCASLASNPKLHFKSFAQILTINSKLTKFNCSSAQKGQIICHPKK